VNGDRLRRLALPVGPGYLASDVDELLLRAADEMEAGRPVGGLVANAALRLPEPLPVIFLPQLRRRAQRPLTYQVKPVDWLLGQLRRCDDDRDRARLENDPWRELHAWDFPERPAPLGHWDRGARAVTGPAGGNAGAWLACGELPGSRLRWVRTGILRSELRAEGGQVSASVRGRVPWTSWGQAGVVQVGGRAFTSQRVSRSEWPGTTAAFGVALPAADGPGLVGVDPHARVLAEQHELPALCTLGQNFDHSAGACIRLSGGRWFQFPVRGRNRRSAIMTALDQDGNKVALYRLVRVAPDQVEIAVHPDQQITDELLLVLALSAPWLGTYFKLANQGG
jgi:hypothetical protein